MSPVSQLISKFENLNKKKPTEKSSGQKTNQSKVYVGQLSSGDGSPVLTRSFDSGFNSSYDRHSDGQNVSDSDYQDAEDTLTAFLNADIDLPDTDDAMTDDLADDVSDDSQEKEDAMSDLPKSDLKKRRLSRKRSSDLKAVLTGFELELEQVEEDGETLNVYSFSYIQPTSLLNKLGVRIGDCLLRLNYKEAMYMNKDEMERALKYNAVLFQMVVGRLDESGTYLEEISTHFKIVRSCKHESDEGASPTEVYDICILAERGVDSDLEVDSSEYHTIARVIKKLKVRDYYIKHDSSYLRSLDERILLEPICDHNDRAYRFRMCEYKAVGMGGIVHPIAVFSNDEYVISGEPTTGVALARADMPDGVVQKLSQKLMQADKGIFLLKRRSGLKCTLESSLYEGHYLCTEDGRTCTIKILDASLDARAQFTLVPPDAKVTLIYC